MKKKRSYYKYEVTWQECDHPSKQFSPLAISKFGWAARNFEGHMGSLMANNIEPWRSKFKVVIIVCYIFFSSINNAWYGSREIKFKWDVEYIFWAPDCIEHYLIGINGKFPGPIILARAGNTIVVELSNKPHTEGLVIHWHGITQDLLSTGMKSCICVTVYVCVIVNSSSVSAFICLFLKQSNDSHTNTLQPSTLVLLALFMFCVSTYIYIFFSCSLELLGQMGLLQYLSVLSTLDKPLFIGSRLIR